MTADPQINSEELINALRKLAGDKESAPGVTMHEIRNHTGWGRCKVYRTIGLAVELGMITAEWTMRPSRITGRQGQAVVYRLAEGKPGGARCSKTSASKTRSPRAR